MKFAMTLNPNICYTRRSDRADNRLTVWLKEAKNGPPHTVQPNLCTCGLKFAPYSRTSVRFPLQAESVHQAMNAGLAVQKVLCTCIGAGLAVRRVPCTSSQHAWTCRESFARSRSREFQCIDTLVPQIWHHAPHPSND